MIYMIAALLLILILIIGGLLLYRANKELFLTIAAVIGLVGTILALIVNIPQAAEFASSLFEPPATAPSVMPTNASKPQSIPLSNCGFLDDSNEEGSNTDVAVGDWTDVFGNYYPNSHRFWVIDKPSWSNTEHVTYQLGGQYETLSGIIAAEQNSHWDAGFVVTIYLDGVPQEPCYTITASSQPLSFEINVSGANEIRVVCSTDTAYNGYCIFSAALS